MRLTVYIPKYLNLLVRTPIQPGLTQISLHNNRGIKARVMKFSAIETGGDVNIRGADQTA